jgi:hypothetical protein
MASHLRLQKRAKKRRSGKGFRRKGQRSDKLNPNFKNSNVQSLRHPVRTGPARRGASHSPGFYFLNIIRERKKEMVRAINIPDMEKKKKRRISLSFINAYLLSNIPT